MAKNPFRYHRYLCEGHCRVNFHSLQEAVFKYNQAVISAVSLYQWANVSFLTCRQEWAES